MPKITLVEPQKKNPRRFNIFLDGVFAFGADEDTVVKFRLVPGKVIEATDQEKILFETEVGKLMGRMYNLFSVRMRSEKEVRDYLRNLNFKKKVKDQEEISKAVIESLINNLKNKGFLNDEVFAKAWVESRSKKKGWRVIQSELMSKGVDREIIESIKHQVVSSTDEKETAENLLEKKVRVWRNLEGQEFRKKATEFLVRRGFDYSVAKEVIDIFLEKDYNSS